MVAGLSLFFSKKIEQPPHLTQYFSLFKIDFSQEFYVSGKSCGKCEICPSSQLTRHAPPFSGYGLMTRDAYVRKKESRICSTKSMSIPRVCVCSPSHGWVTPANAAVRMAGEELYTWRVCA